jgi:hypothetical protein
MNGVFVVLVSCTIVLTAASAWAEQPKQDRVYYMRKALCEREAAAKHFGMHWIKRQRYVRKCLAESTR